MRWNAFRGMSVAIGALILGCSHTPTQTALNNSDYQRNSSDYQRRPASSDDYSCLERARNNLGSKGKPAPGEQYCEYEVPKKECPDLDPGASEEAIFDCLGDHINKIQDQVLEELKAKAAEGKLGNEVPALHRGFHAKHHGCLVGTMTVGSDVVVPDERDAGVLVPGNSYKVIVRFSNAANEAGPDSAVDARGFAVKLLAQTNDQPLPGGVTNQDFLMTNQPTANGKDAIEFMQFAIAMQGNGQDKIDFGKDHPKVVFETGKLVPKQFILQSAALERYWAKTPFRWGRGPQEGDEKGKVQYGPAVHFLVEPSEDNKQFKNSQKTLLSLHKKSPTFLQEDLVERTAAGPIDFDFKVQYQGADLKHLDAVHFPTENGLVAWNEKVSKPITVAKIHLFQQQFLTQDKQNFCEALSMDPWHHVKGHEPLGSLNRGRRVVYLASKNKRLKEAKGTGPKETTLKEVEDLYGEIVEHASGVGHN